MWQEFIRLREAYLKQAITHNDVHRELVRNQLLYEIFKLGGNALPETEFLEIIRTDKRPHGTTPLKAYDLWQAWKYTTEKADKHTAFTPELVQQIAARVMKHTGGETTTSIGRYDSSLGDFRLGEDYNSIYPIANYDKIPDLLTTLCRQVNVQLQQQPGVTGLIKTAISYLFEFAHIKPFGAGNIETGMLSMNYLLLYHQQPLLIIFGDDRAAALNALKSKDISQTPEEFETFVIQEQIKFLTSVVTQ